MLMGMRGQTQLMSVECLAWLVWGYAGRAMSHPDSLL